MSSPEKQPSYDDQPQPDELEQFTALKCRKNIGKLLKVANELGAYTVVDPNQFELDVDISRIASTNFNELGIFFKSRETVNFFVTHEVDMLAYRIRHDTTTEVSYDNSQCLRREFWLVFGKNADGEMGISPLLSNHDVQLYPIRNQAIMMVALHNEGEPLQEWESELFNASDRDMAQIKSYQLEEIEQLVSRTLEAVRANA